MQVRYKQSLLGAAWAILQPLSMMLVFTVIFSQFAKIPSDGIPYPIFCYAALLPWSFFAGSLSAAIPSLVNNANLVTKIYFPREIFPIAAVSAAGVDFAIASVIFGGMLIYYRVPLTWNALYVFPALVIQIILTLAVALLASAINVRYRDAKHALPLLILLWMYATPIVYPASLVPDRLLTLYMLNPMAVLIDTYRRVMLRGIPPDLAYLGLATGVIIAVFLFSFWYFKRQEMTFADII